MSEESKIDVKHDAELRDKENHSSRARLKFGRIAYVIEAGLKTCSTLERAASPPRFSHFLVHPFLFTRKTHTRASVLLCRTTKHTNADRHSYTHVETNQTQCYRESETLSLGSARIRVSRYVTLPNCRPKDIGQLNVKRQ